MPTAAMSSSNTRMRECFLLTTQRKNTTRAMKAPSTQTKVRLFRRALASRCCCSASVSCSPGMRRINGKPVYILKPFCGRNGYGPGSRAQAGGRSHPEPGNADGHRRLLRGVLGARGLPTAAGEKAVPHQGGWLVRHPPEQEAAARQLHDGRGHCLGSQGQLPAPEREKGQAQRRNKGPLLRGGRLAPLCHGRPE